MTTPALAPAPAPAAAPAPDHSIRPLSDPLPPLTVLYDDLCEFCRWTATSLRRWDRDRVLRFRPMHGAERTPILGDLVRGHDLGDHVHVVDSAGRVAVGSEALLAITALLPNGRGVTRLFDWSPPAALVLDGFYRVLNRKRGIVADLFHLNGGRLLEPSGLDPESTDIGPEPERAEL
jgi:predicted DCC family thiol-disulfide oxidoreductase YuxK